MAQRLFQMFQIRGVVDPTITLSLIFKSWFINVLYFVKVLNDEGRQVNYDADLLSSQYACVYISKP